MEQRGAPIRPLSDVNDLRVLADRPGPFLSAYLPLGPANEELAEATGLRWRELRHRAEVGGAPTDLLDRIDAEVADAHRTGAGLCVTSHPTSPGATRPRPRSRATTTRCARWPRADGPSAASSSGPRRPGSGT